MELKSVQMDKGVSHGTQKAHGFIRHSVTWKCVNSNGVDNFRLLCRWWFYSVCCCAGVCSSVLGTALLFLALKHVCSVNYILSILAKGQEYIIE